MPGVAIVILNYNTSSDCVKCVSFLKRQRDVNYEIIVVDNCSNEDDVFNLISFCKQEKITILQSKENRGYSAGNNIGLRYAAEKGYEYALIINPDVELHQHDYLKCLRDKIILDNSIVVIGSDILNVDGSHGNPLCEISYWKEFLWPFVLAKKLFSGNTKQDLVDFTKSKYCNKLLGCCFIVRIKFLESIGFLDENTFLYCEEPILAKQVYLAKYKMYYFAGATAIHKHIESKKGNKSARLKIALKSREYYLKNYSGYPSFALKLLIWSKKLHFNIKYIFHI